MLASHYDVLMTFLMSLTMNRVLSEQNTGFVIQPPNLISQDAQELINVSEEPLSLDQQAQEIIQQALAQSEKLCLKDMIGQPSRKFYGFSKLSPLPFRGSILTWGPFRGNTSIRSPMIYEGSIEEVRWRRFLTGSRLYTVICPRPTGGGIRHGTDLKAGIATQPNEARLFCNLIRSYIGYLIAEHKRLSNQ